MKAVSGKAHRIMTILVLDARMSHLACHESLVSVSKWRPSPCLTRIRFEFVKIRRVICELRIGNLGQFGLLHAIARSSQKHLVSKRFSAIANQNGTLAAIRSSSSQVPSGEIRSYLVSIYPVGENAATEPSES